jgi:hypothetical protein
MNLKQLKITIDALMNEGFGDTEVIGIDTRTGVSSRVQMYHTTTRNDGTDEAGLLLERPKDHLYIPLYISN